MTQPAQQSVNRPAGLEREHHWQGAPWYPHADAVVVAIAKPRYMDVDDNVDRYLLRCKELHKQPSSQEWLRWLLDDDTKAIAAARVESMRSQSLTDDTGTPRTWKV